MPASTDRTTAVATLTLFGVSLLVGSLFFQWLEIPYREVEGGAISLSGWSALETGDALFVLIALVAAGLAYLRGLRGPWPLLLALTAAAVVITFAVSTTPAVELSEAYAGQDSSHDAYDFGPGLFIAAAGTVLLLVAGLFEARGHLAERQLDA